MGLSANVEILLIAVVAAAACALPGVFLILRKMAMMSDAISHAILPGIVVAFFVTSNLNSPLLIVGAALTGVLTVFLVETLMSTRLLREDAAMGLTFPVLFSIGVVLIARYAGDIHLDTDAVLLGELAFAPFDRFTIGGRDIAPAALVTMTVVLLLNMAFILLFYKELKLSTFDAGLAAALGFSPVAVHYVLMGLVSTTAVAAFDAMGSILVVALMIGPPACAYLLTNNLSRLTILSVIIGAACAAGGFAMAAAFDYSIAGSIAVVIGLTFAAVFLFSPLDGLIVQNIRKEKRRIGFGEKLLAIHLIQHEGLPEEERENREIHLQEHLNWDESFAEDVVALALRNGNVLREGPMLVLTDSGRELATSSVVDP